MILKSNNTVVVPRIALAVFLLFAATIEPLSAQDESTADYFRQNCAGCHTVGGGRLIGPDLKGVSKRRYRPRLVEFILNPKTAIDSGDAYAIQLRDEANGFVMPTFVGLTAQRAQALLDLIESESKLQRSRFLGPPIEDRPFSPNQASDGRSIFMGAQRLRSGAPPCVSCHTIKGLEPNNHLGPDLTAAYIRLNGRRGLGAFLTNPATPTMSSVFRKLIIGPNEITGLLAYFESVAKDSRSNIR